MKKLIALLLAVVMVMSMVACGTNNNTTAGETENTEPAKGADEVFNAAVAKFLATLAPLFDVAVEDMQYFFGGGYFSEDETTVKMGEAGKTPLDVEDAVNTFKMVSLISEETFAKIDDAAVFHHSMNMNTFAASSMKVANAADVESVANSLKNSVGGNEVWDCGFPERYLIITVDAYVISVYGNADMVNAMKTAVTETYANAVVVADEAFA